MPPLLPTAINLAENWSLADRSKVVVVTGATNGIGRETAERLAGMGATVVLACRNLNAAEAVAADIRTLHPHAKIIVGPQLDLGDQNSIRSFAAEYKTKGWPLHVLINNAGANHYGQPYYTPGGIGGLCQVNYLGPYTLTRLLEPELQRSAPSRVVNVSSIMHRLGTIGDPSTFLLAWTQGSIYANTKLANALFAFELHRRLAHKGVVSCAVDPGGVATGIWKGGVFSKPPLKWFIDAMYAPASDGASAVIHAATVPWNRDAAASSQVNTQWNTEHSGTENKPQDDLRFYARGLFSWPTITQTLGEPGVGPLAGAWRSLWGLSALVHSAADWPMRWMSGKRFQCETHVVPANPLAYDRKLCKELWEVSADAAGVPKECVAPSHVDLSSGNSAEEQ